MDLPRLSGDILGCDEFRRPFATADFDGIAQEGLIIAWRFASEKGGLAEHRMREIGELLVFGEISVLLPVLAFELQAAAAQLLCRVDIGYILRHLLQEVLRLVYVHHEIDIFVIAASLDIDQMLE